jgi:cytoskeletal protein CcmA (bactofilin family)
MDWSRRDMRMDKSPQSARGLGSTPTSTIAEDLVITGNVTSKGEIHLDGQVRGDIHCLSLVVSEKSQIEGNVVAEEIAIRGSIIGSVRALRVALHHQCHVEGDLFHHSLTIAQGAYFDGEARPCDPVGRCEPEPTPGLHRWLLWALTSQNA